MFVRERRDGVAPAFYCVGAVGAGGERGGEGKIKAVALTCG
jgi:hypothetical protein